MRSDLLGSQASVDWAVSNFPALEDRLKVWLEANIYIDIKEFDVNSTDNLIVAAEKELLPLLFNAEVGAYINAIRSALDILACALAHRYDMPRPNDMYFPIVKSAEIFASGKFNGNRFLEGLPSSERAQIEALKPYNGGHELLWPLHQLDIMRKHKRLINVDVGPETFNIKMPGNIENCVTLIAGGWLRTGNQETALAFIKKRAPKPHIRFTPRVLLDESALEGKPLMSALNEFARLAHSIIGCFDVP